jgi:hypothetical protein
MRAEEATSERMPQSTGPSGLSLSRKRGLNVRSRSRAARVCRDADFCDDCHEVLPSAKLRINQPRRASRP